MLQRNFVHFNARVLLSFTATVRQFASIDIR